MVGGTFVGRTEQIKEIEHLLDSVSKGRGQTLLLTGEAGIGKTTLAEQGESLAAAREFAVYWGRCWEHGGSPPLFPWIQILREISASRPGTGLSDNEKHTEVIGRLLSPDEERDVEAGDRFAVLDSVVGFLRSAGRSKPLLLVLEDIHSADESTLVLLLFAARNLHASNVGILATFRTGEKEENPQIAEIAKEGRRMSLGPLSVGEVVKLFESRGGRNAADRAAELHEATGGNPLLTIEMARSEEATALADRSTHGVAANVRSMIDLRLRALPDETRSLLATASVLGRNIETPIVRSLTMLDDATLEKALRGAVAAGILTRFEDGWAFVHDLIRRALYDELDSSARALLHQRAADALEQLDPDGSEGRAAEIAHHLMRAGGADPRNRGARASVRAGKLALRRHAYEEAERHLANASKLFTPQASERIEALTQLVEAQLGQGKKAEALETAIVAAELAERCEQPIEMATALITLAFHRYVAAGDADRRILALVDRALTSLPADAEAQRAMLKALRLFEDYIETDQETEAELRAILPKLRRSDQPLPLLYILRTLLLTSTALDPEGALAYARELREVSSRHGLIESEARAVHRLCTIYLERGEMARFDTELERLTKSTFSDHIPFLKWSLICLKTTQALVRGDFDQAASRADEAVAVADQIENQNGLIAWGGAHVAILEHRGSLEDLIEWNTASIDHFPSLLIPRAGLATILAESGRIEEARTRLAPVMNSLDGVRKDLTWLGTLALCGRALTTTGDRDDAARIYAMLRPFEKRHWFIDVGLPVSYHGSIALILGLLAETMGDHPSAIKHQEIGLKLHENAGAAPYAAWSRFYLGRLHLDSDPERAASFLDRAEAAAEELGMVRLTEAIGKVRDRGATPETAAKRDLKMTLEGDYWNVTVDGRTLTLKDIRGFHYLAALLRSPDKELHSLDLVMTWSGVLPHRGPEPGLDVSGAPVGDVLLDPEAKAAYKTRIEELREDIEDAERNGDLGRRERAQQELDFIADQLSAALGMGGRARTWSDPSEKARVSVTKSLKRALARIAKEDQELGAFLEAAISTGTFCCFNASVFPWAVTVNR